MNYKIITAVWNAERFFPGYVKSIACQSNSNYEVVIIDDASTDGTTELVRQAGEEHGWNVILNTENKGALYNQVHGIRSLDCQPDDVLVFVDGDDRLAHREVLHRLDAYYVDGIQLTFGQYQPVPDSATCTLAARIPDDLMAKRNFREVVRRHGGLYWNHLRTFKYEIFSQLDDSDFTNSFGEWYKTATDAALMYPCLELAAPNVQFIDEVLLFYTSDNEISDWRRWPRQCDRDHEDILTKPRKR